jgi:uncharacterized membrane protein
MCRLARLAFLSIVFVAACADSSTGIDTAALTCPPDSTLTYQSFGEPLIADRCLSCHASRESPRLTSVEQIRANSAAIMESAVGTSKMPEGIGMSLEERELLGEWLACGAP